MKFYDEQLQKLQEQIARKRQLEAQVSELRTQRSTLSTRVRELEAIKMQEQADVDKLEGRSLAAFFYNVIGKMDEQLNKEREEAYPCAGRQDLNWWCPHERKTTDAIRLCVVDRPHQSDHLIQKSRGL